MRGPWRRSSSTHSAAGEIRSPAEDQLGRLRGYAEYLQPAWPTMCSGGARPGDGASPWRTSSLTDWWRSRRRRTGGRTSLEPAAPATSPNRLHRDLPCPRHAHCPPSRNRHAICCEADEQGWRGAARRWPPGER
jgi:hypothetical protein